MAADGSVVRQITAIPVSVPYLHRERSSVVERDGVSDVVIRLETDDGAVGWGESCAGADTESVVAAVKAMSAFAIGRSCWEAERMRRDVMHYGLWQFREGTANFAWAGIDMALWDVCGRRAGLPVHQLLGGAIQDRVNYFWYLSWGDDASLAAQCAAGRAAGYDVFYLKVGIDITEDLHRVATVRQELGPGPRLRIDANGAWSPSDAIRHLRALAQFDIDFVEQPVRESPPELLRRLRDANIIPVAANEGLWTEADAMTRILADNADVYCFSPYWVGSLRSFQFLGTLAGRRGAAVCKHTHGELAIAAAAAHQVMLTLPAIVRGNQQTTAHMADDVADSPLRQGPDWGVPDAPGLGVNVDAERLQEAAARYARYGQFQPFQLDELSARWKT